MAGKLGGDDVTTERIWIGTGALYGLLGVIVAALAAHALPQRLSVAGLALVQTAIEMQMWHALALIGCGVLQRQRGLAGRLLPMAGAGFALGTLIFCGSVYAIALTGIRLPGLAPVGGLLIMGGWLCLGLSAVRGTPIRLREMDATVVPLTHRRPARWASGQDGLDGRPPRPR
jgi:uncharacterized membrane protein YgdD (TMEM256/DUF423 family)